MFLADHGGWPELLPFMFKLTTSKEESHVESSLNIFSQLAILLGAETFRPYFTNIMAILQSGLSDQRLRIKLGALNATSAFLQIMEEEEDQTHITQYQSLLPMMLSCISDALNQQKEQEARKALEMFVELVEVEPLFFKPSLQTLINAMFQIAQATSLEDETRRYALEVMVSLSESKPVMMKKQPDFVKNMVWLLLSWMVGVQDFKEWYDFSDPDEVSNDDIAEDALDRICLCLKGKSVVPVLFQNISALLANKDDWRQRHAGIMAISVAAEGCKFVLRNHTAEIMAFLAPVFADPHPRVRWAASNCLGQLCIDFFPDFQTKHAAQMVPLMIVAMQDPTPRCAAHGATCVINFAEYSTPDVLMPHVPTILATLHSLLMTAPLKVQEVVFTALSTVVENCEDKFLPYYDQFVPYLKSVVQKASGQKEYALLRGKAMECLSLVGCAVKKEKFAPDAREVLDLMLRTQVVAADDPQIGYLESAFARLAECLGADFAPYLPIVMPSSMQRAQMKADLQVLASEAETPQGWDVYSLGDKAIGIHTSLLEEKASATQILLCYAAHLGEAFFPYVEEVARLVNNNITFYYNDEVRGAIIALIPELLKVTAAHMKTTATPADKTPLVRLWQFMLEMIVKALPDEPESSLRAALLQSIQESMDVIQVPCIPEDHMAPLAEALKTMLNEWVANKEQRDQKKGAGEFDDEEDKEALEEHEELQDDLLTNIVDTIGKILKVHRGQFLQAYHDFLLPLATHFIKPESDPLMRQKGLCMFDDIVEHTGVSSLPLVTHYLPAMLNYTADSDPAVVQAAVFGLGISGQYLGDHFAPYINDALARLQAVVSRMSAEAAEDFKYAVDNAIAAVGKILFGQAARLSLPDLVPAWVARLPLRTDMVESRICTGLLLTFYDQMGQGILGKDTTMAGAVHVQRQR
jgi:hypothetical protein